jgi:hypothetical protein
MSDPLKAIGGGSNFSELQQLQQLQKSDQVSGLQTQDQGAAKTVDKPQETAKIDTKDKVNLSEEVKGADKVGSTNEVKDADKVNKTEETKETEKPNESKFEELKKQLQKLAELQPGQAVGQSEEAAKSQAPKGAAEAQKV